MHELRTPKSNFQHILLFCVGFIAASCSSSRVVQYINTEASFKNFNTYKIINFKTDNKEYSAEGNAFIDSVEYYISREMQMKGYNTGPKSDLLVRYELISGVESEVNYNNNGYYGGGFGRYAYSPFYDPYYYGPRTSRHIEGVLLLEIKERKNRKLVWQGSMDLKYSKKKNDNNMELMKDAIIQIFETYKYQAGSPHPMVTENK
ncbi:MAG: DUF4136 domain-containing protein [Cyclobacteriaceae bacterium]